MSAKARLCGREKQPTGASKDAVICLEGMCLKGETARRAAILVAHKPVPDKAARICHGGLLEAAGGMKDLVQRANRVLIQELIVRYPAP